MPQKVRRPYDYFCCVRLIGGLLDTFRMRPCLLLFAGYIKGFGSHKPGTMTTKAKFVSLDKRKFEIVAPPMDGV